MVGRARRYALGISIPARKQPGWAWTPRSVALVAVDELGAIAVDSDVSYWEAGASP
jgi:hypothetical protein